MPTIAELAQARALAARLGLRILIIAGVRVELLEDSRAVATLPTWGAAVGALEAGWRQMSFLEGA